MKISAETMPSNGITLSYAQSPQVILMPATHSIIVQILKVVVPVDNPSLS